VYFESSASMPYHWLNAALITAPTTNDDKGVKKYSGPSNPQRDLPYASFDLARGIKKLQAGGVRYYLALTDIAKTAAASIPELKKVGGSGVFVFYEIANSELVSPLGEEPVKITGIDDDQYGGWLDVQVDQYNNPDQYPQTLVWSGPKSWSTMRATVKHPENTRTFGSGVSKVATLTRKPLQPVVVSNIKKNNVDISFTVDRIGVPVVVKTSFFPNWTAQGAKGPYRSMPNFMVVIPTSKNVKLHYGYSGADKVGYLATFAAIAGVALLHRTRRRRTFGVVDELDHIPTIEHGLHEVLAGETATQNTTQDTTQNTTQSTTHNATQSTTQNTIQGKTSIAQTATATSSLSGQTADSSGFAPGPDSTVGSIGSASGTETLNATGPATIETIVVENSALATASSSSVSQVANGEVTTAQTKNAASIEPILDQVTPALLTATDADDTGSVAGHEPKKA
jgi:hypothetical protein